MRGGAMVLVVLAQHHTLKKAGHVCWSQKGAARGWRRKWRRRRREEGFRFPFEGPRVWDEVENFVPRLGIMVKP